MHSFFLLKYVKIFQELPGNPGYSGVGGGSSMRQARSVGQLPMRPQAGNSARPITGQQQQVINTQRMMQGISLVVEIDGNSLCGVKTVAFHDQS
jgi:hypothetical protein